MSVEKLPLVNACLNSTSAIFLILGIYFIKNKKVRAHRACMLAAAAASTLFLASYLYYHYHHGSTKYPHHDWTRPVYFTILITHTILAVLNLPFILKTFWHALRGEIDKHKKIARLTFPVWLYVSVTGVIIYWMLYQS